MTPLRLGWSPDSAWCTRRAPRRPFPLSPDACCWRLPHPPSQRYLRRSRCLGQQAPLGHLPRGRAGCYLRPPLSLLSAVCPGYLPRQGRLRYLRSLQNQVLTKARGYLPPPTYQRHLRCCRQRHPRGRRRLPRSRANTYTCPSPLCRGCRRRRPKTPSTSTNLSTIR